MNIAFVTETFPPEANGAAMTAGRLVDALLSRGHRVQLVRPRPMETAARLAPGGPEQLHVRGLSLPMYRGVQIGLPAGARLVSAWTARRPHLVHVVTEGPLGWSALQAARRLRIPVTSGFHTNFHTYMGLYGLPWLGQAAVGYLRAFHNRTAATLVPTEQTRADLRGLGFRNVAVVSRGVDTRLYTPHKRRPDLRQRWRAADDAPVVLLVGRLAKEKNLDLAVEAFCAMRRERPQARLVVVGDGPLRAGLQARHPEVIFTGTLRGEELAAHYASADIFLFPSLTETFGNVVLEAMASGLAVVAFDDAAAREHVQDGENGLVVARGDRRSFVETAVELGRHLHVARRLGEQARRTTLALSWDEIGGRFEELLARAAAGHPVDEACLDRPAPTRTAARRPRTQPA